MTKQKNILLEEKYLRMVKDIVSKNLDLSKNKVFIFGSRVNGTAKKYSDIDLGIEPEEEFSVLMMLNLKDVFENSDLPYIVDIFDMSKEDEKFKKIVKKKVFYL